LFKVFKMSDSPVNFRFPICPKNIEHASLSCFAYNFMPLFILVHGFANLTSADQIGAEFLEKMFVTREIL